MGILVKPPITVRVDTAGLTNILPNTLPPNFCYRIYALDLSAVKSTREVSLEESGIKRWSGIMKQQTNWRLDFGPAGWTIGHGNTLDVVTSGKLKLDINLLQWGIIEIRTNNG
jgi:hypothetical protein